MSLLTFIVLLNVFVRLFEIQWSNAEVTTQNELYPLGSHHQPEGIISTLSQLSSQEFFNQYFSKGKPVIIKGLLDRTQPLMAWDNHYLEENFGNEFVNIETTKVENRSMESYDLLLKQFLSKYMASSHMYLIGTLPHSMQQEFELPSCLKCSFFINRLQDFVLWFSGGNTKSFLHYDNVENLYCQLDGVKHWFLVDPINGSKHIIEDHPEGNYCGVNISAVDIHMYPGLATVPWWKATVFPGDCIYVPVNWWHQVSSKSGRNMAVNIWWAPFLEGLPNNDCNFINKSIKLSELSFTPGEWIRWALAMFVKRHGNRVDFETMRKYVVHEHTGEKLVTRNSFDIFDNNLDGVVNVDELLNIPSEEIHLAVHNVEIGAMNTNGHHMPNVEDSSSEDIDMYAKQEL